MYVRKSFLRIFDPNLNGYCCCLEMTVFDTRMLCNLLLGMKLKCIWVCIFILKIMLKTLEDAVFHRNKFPAEFYARDTHSRCMLALGAVSHKLMKEGKAEKARDIVNKIHSMLGLHGQLEII